MLIRRIVADTVRRSWGLYAIAIAAVFFNALLAERTEADGVKLRAMSDLVAWAMAATWFLASVPAPLLEAREIAILPVSRRELWIARWWLAVAAPTAAIAIGVGIALAVPNSGLTLESALLVPAFCTLYGGCCIALSAVVRMPAKTGSKRRILTLAMLYFLVIPLGGAVAPFWFAKYLPQAFSELRGPAWSSLIAAAGLTLASYFHYPRITERASRRRIPSATASSATSSETAPRLSGVPLLFWKETRKLLILYTSFLLVGLAYWWVFEARSLADFLHAGNALIFAQLPPQTGGTFPVALILMATGSSELGLAGEMRALRALPISVRGLSAILSGLGVMAAAILWMVLLAVHVIVVSTRPLSLRPDLFFVLSGAISLSIAVRLTMPANNGVKMLSAMVVMIPTMFLLTRFYAMPESIWIRAAMIAGGGAALILSWLLNLRTLRRGRRIYKPQPITVISS